MAYEKQNWNNDDPTTPVSAERLSYMEAGIEAANDHQPLSFIVVHKDPVTGFWPSGYDANGEPIYTDGAPNDGVRPTARQDVTVGWAGPDPSPATVESGTGGMHNGDIRMLRP